MKERKIIVKTAYNSAYSNYYSVLFNEASELLGLESPITSLEEYFSHIGDLAIKHSNQVAISGDPKGYAEYSRFLMLPMEEVYGDGVFAIDANARTIKVPSNFSKNGVSITGDNLAETLLFEIDRFFDVTDLVTTQIYVQWTNPAGQEGASRITMVDYTSKPGKMLFGWPLTDKVTVEGNGKLQFSVRFFKRNSAGEVTYSLNTLPVTVAIKQALHTDVNDKIDIDDPSSLFATVIENGVLAGMPNAAAPEFDDNLISLAYLDSNDQIPLDISMFVNDTGALSYVLYYTPAYNENNDIYPKDKSTQTIDIERSYVEVPEGATFDAKKRYYVQDENSFVQVADPSLDTTKTYYEEHAQYNIAYDAETNPHVTGTYRFGVKNSLAQSNSVTVYSNTMLVPCVDSETLKFTKDLEPDNVVQEGNTSTTLEIAAIAQTIKIGEVGGDSIDPVYTWERKTANDSDFAVVEGVSSNSLVADETGWYRATATATANHESCSVVSNECRVVNLPEAPVVSPAATEIKDIQDLEVGSTATFEIKLESTYIDNLTSDEIKYIWYRNALDVGESKVKAGDPDVIGDVGTATLTVQLLKDMAMVDYYCKVVNVLAGNEAVTESGKFAIV